MWPRWARRPPTLPPARRRISRCRAARGTRAALHAHLRWIEAHAPSYRAILHGGVSGDLEVQLIVERSRSEVVRRITRGIGGGRPSPMMRIALRGWIGFLEAASLDWLDRKDVTKEQLVDLLARSLSATIRSANEPRSVKRALN